MTTLTVAGGCFWCVDAVFRRIKGVSTSICGYAGGEQGDANYYRVASGHTGHAESVQVTFDEAVIPADILLDIFFLIHNPTTLNRQGNDEGPQYRSAVFYADEAQKSLFDQAIERATKTWDDPIVTEVVPLETFYEGEPEHQDYFNNNPGNGYCSIVILPKIIKARKEYLSWFKEES
ncbi:MAG: peptide-methionine (S)-S-oxide reductase MsrA [Candidatus Saccharimonadales bacterium]